jgi:Phage integrase, N-terminal SAM-like domain
MATFLPDKSETRKPKLLGELRRVLRFTHYNLRTEEAYVEWVRRFIVFHGKCHPRGMGAAEVRAFLTHLVTERKVSASIQNQAFSAGAFSRGACAWGNWAGAAWSFSGDAICRRHASGEMTGAARVCIDAA